METILAGLRQLRTISKRAFPKLGYSKKIMVPLKSLSQKFQNENHVMVLVVPLENLK
jgi:hypothetical protein